ncbi:hypothetical protein N7497_009170 [Penicillium chrysogenum]|nr:hypothetical protein N7497_009170 [Penicillium chrysogenum]
MTYDKQNNGSLAKPFTPTLSAAFHRSNKSPLTPKLASPSPGAGPGFPRRLAQPDHPYSTPSKDDSPRGPDLFKRQRHSTVWSSNHPARWRSLLPHKYITCPLSLSTYTLLPVDNRLWPSRPQPGSRGQAGTITKFEGKDLDGRESAYTTSEFFLRYDIGNSAVLSCVRCTIVTSC